MIQIIFIKIILVVFILLNFLIYEFLNKQSETVHVLKLHFEEHIPFLPYFSIPYILFIPFLLITIIYFIFFYKDFKSVFISFISCQLTAYIIYTFYQTSVTRPDIVFKDTFSTLVAYIYSIDKPYNCFPSLHVSLSIICLLYWIKILPRFQIIMNIFVMLITLSTVFIKQHYVLDVISGIILAIVSFYIGQTFSDKLNVPDNIKELR